MSTLPQLLEEDIAAMDVSLRSLLKKSEASAAVIIDRGGFLITRQGDEDGLDVTTLAALCSNTYAASQMIAELIGEENFSSVYQQGETYSILVGNVDEHCLLVAIFRAQISVGAVKYYSVNVISQVSQQLEMAQNRAPGEGLDLSVLNVADTSEVFMQKGPEEEEVADDGYPNDPIAKLHKMKKLLAGGLITQEDFDQMKRRILEQM